MFAVNRCTCCRILSRRSTSSSAFPSASSSSTVDRPPRANYGNEGRKEGALVRQRVLSHQLQPKDPKQRPTPDESTWRSNVHAGPKKDYVELGQRSSPVPSRSTRTYDTLHPEEKRREDMRMVERMRAVGESKLYAREREDRRYGATARPRPPMPTMRSDPRDSGSVGQRTVVDGRVERRNSGPADRSSSGYQPLASSVTSPNRSSSSSYPYPSSSQSPRVSSDRHAAQVSRQAYDRNRSNQSDRLIPGAYNASLRSNSTQKKNVQPIARAGGVATRNAPRKRAKVLKKVVLPNTIRLENLTNILGVKLYLLQRAMDRIGLENTRAERLLTSEDASLIAMELDFDPIIDDDAAFDIYPSSPHPDPSVLPLRPPITGIFGHVDHGKTSLLDALRSTAVAAGEAGGITQHIGAFEVSLDRMVQSLKDRESRAKSIKSHPPLKSSTKKDAKASVEAAGGATITFLDTPGHAAFTAMRQRGAGVTDVVILVVAADDGVKPQTEEVIRLIKSSDVGVVVAITKVDKPGVDTVKVKQSLMAAGVEVEDFGGEVPCVEVSSVTGQGLPELLETIAAIAEVRELKAEREGRMEGRVIESRVERGRGNVATVLVLRGCLKPSSALIAGTTWCRVRQLLPPSGQAVQAVYPGQPIEVSGWKDLPLAGDEVLEAPSEEQAKDAVANRIKRIEVEKMWSDVEVINEKRRLEAEVAVARKEGEGEAKAKGLKGNAVTLAGLSAIEGMEGAKKLAQIKELILVLKGDVSGTVEAVVGALEGIGNKEAKVKIIHTGVGDISESDVEMARAVEGCVVGFNVKAPRSIIQLAARPPYSVPIHTSPVIYRLVDTIRQAVIDLLPKIFEVRVHGEANIQQVFDIDVKGKKGGVKVAGCKVGNGSISKARKARVVRNGETIFTGPVSTLKQSKKDVLETLKGVECGIALEGFDGYELNDTIQSIEEFEVPRSL